MAGQGKGKARARQGRVRQGRLFNVLLGQRIALLDCVRCQIMYINHCT